MSVLRYFSVLIGITFSSMAMEKLFRRTDRMGMRSRTAVSKVHPREANRCGKPPWQQLKEGENDALTPTRRARHYRVRPTTSGPRRALMSRPAHQLNSKRLDKARAVL